MPLLFHSQMQFKLEPLVVLNIEQLFFIFKWSNVQLLFTSSELRAILYSILACNTSHVEISAVQ